MWLSSARLRTTAGSRLSRGNSGKSPGRWSGGRTPAFHGPQRATKGTASFSWPPRNAARITRSFSLQVGVRTAKTQGSSSSPQPPRRRRGPGSPHLFPQTAGSGSSLFPPLRGKSSRNMRSCGQCLLFANRFYRVFKPLKA